MDTDDNEIYDYDRSSFFRLLQSPKYHIKYEFIQQHEGLVVCPLKLKINPRLTKQSESIIDTHLFFPSPFYKNRFIPISSLNQLNSLTSLNIQTISLDHSQQVSLNINSEDVNELIIMHNRRRICKNVKLLNIQTAFSNNCKTYKILIVNKELYFKQSSVHLSQQRRLTAPNHGDTDTIEEANEESDDLEKLDEQINETFENFHNQNSDNSLTSSYDNNGISSTDYIPAVSHRNSTFMQEVTYNSLDDVKKFGQSVDFIQNCGFTDNRQSLLDQEENDNEISTNRKQSRRISQQLKKKHNQPSLIGEDLLNEIELFRKTYIILVTHMYDCELQLQKMFTKYVCRFLDAAKKSMNLDSNSTTYNNIELMISIACENTIVGCLFAKLWPCILKLNVEQDALIQKKCNRVRKLLRLDQVVEITNETCELCSRFFHIEKKYFFINIQPVLREFKQLSLLNNPFEKLDCIKSSVQLVTNELTILSSMKKTKKSSDDKSEDSSFIITSDVLIPLIAFILIQSNINCFKSICDFIEKFQFSSLENSFTSSHCSTRLDELAFFMTTFKAAIQFIESSY